MVLSPCDHGNVACGVVGFRSTYGRSIDLNMPGPEVESKWIEPLGLATQSCPPPSKIARYDKIAGVRGIPAVSVPERQHVVKQCTGTEPM